MCKLSKIVTVKLQHKWGGVGQTLNLDLDGLDQGPVDALEH